MPKKKSKTTNMTFWFWVCIVGAVIAAPHAAVIKYTIGGYDQFGFLAYRFLITSIIMTPFVLLNISKFNRKNTADTIKAGVYLALSILFYVSALKYSQASYVSIILLIDPIIFILFSAKMNKEKITSKSLAGISIAAFGAAVIVLVPIAIHQNSDVFVFYPLATLFALANCVIFPLSIIYCRKANENGLSMPALIGASSWVMFAVTFVAMLVLGKSLPTNLDNKFWFGVLFGAIVISIISRIMNVLSYEHVGASVSGAVWYLEVFLAVLVPVIFLHEKLSLSMVIGGLIILLGVYIVEHHKFKHHKHHHIFHHH